MSNYSLHTHFALDPGEPRPGKLDVVSIAGGVHSKGTISCLAFSADTRSMCVVRAGARNSRRGPGLATRKICDLKLGLSRM